MTKEEIQLIKNLEYSSIKVRPKINLHIDYYIPEELQSIGPRYAGFTQEEIDEREHKLRQRYELTDRYNGIINSILEEEIPRYLSMIGWDKEYKIEDKNYISSIAKDIIIIL